MALCSEQSGSLHTEVVSGGRRRIVFLHGLMGRGKNFSTIARGIAETTTSLLVDLPNHGASCWTEGFDYIEMADLVADELRSDFCATEPAVILGHSMGGKVAMILALRHPDLVNGLIVEDIAPVSSVGTSEFVHLLGTLLRLDLDALKSRTDAQQKIKTDIDDPRVSGFLLQNLTRTDNGFAWEPNLQMLFDNLDDVMGFPNIDAVYDDVPVMWMKGERSNYINDETEVSMRKLFPMTRKVQIRDSGHWIHSEQPQKFMETVNYYVAGRYN